jgi:hypothetical protein
MLVYIIQYICVGVSLFVGHVVKLFNALCGAEERKITWADSLHSTQNLMLPAPPRPCW